MEISEIKKEFDLSSEGDSVFDTTTVLKSLSTFNNKSVDSCGNIADYYDFPYIQLPKQLDIWVNNVDLDCETLINIISEYADVIQGERRLTRQALLYYRCESEYIRTWKDHRKRILPPCKPIPPIKPKPFVIPEEINEKINFGKFLKLKNVILDLIFITLYVFTICTFIFGNYPVSDLIGFMIFGGIFLCVIHLFCARGRFFFEEWIDEDYVEVCDEDYDESTKKVSLERQPLVKEYEAAINRYEVLIDEYQQSMKQYNEQLQQYNEQLRLKEEEAKAERDNYIKRHLNGAFSNFIRTNDKFEEEVRTVSEDIMPKFGKMDERFFYLLMKANIKNIKLGVKTGRYYPDICVTDGHFLLDIEIDEPYSLPDKKCIHYIESDDSQRNSFFWDSNAYVIRFTENQIKHHADACINIVKYFVNFATTGIVETSIDILSILNSIKEKRWSREEAKVMAMDDYRNK